MATETLKRSVPRLALRPAEAAEALGMSLPHFRRHVLPNVKTVYSGDVRLIPIAALQAWLDSQPETGRRRRRRGEEE